MILWIMIVKCGLAGNKTIDFLNAANCLQQQIKKYRDKKWLTRAIHLSFVHGITRQQPNYSCSKSFVHFDRVIPFEYFLRWKIARNIGLNN